MMTSTSRPTPCRSKEAGVSLIELLISMSVLAVVVGALAQGLTLGVRMNTDSKAGVSSLNLCKRVLEKVKSQVQYSQANFDAATTNNNFNRAFYTDADGIEITDNSVGNFKVTTAVSDWTDSGGTSLSATDANGVSHVMVKVLTVTVHTQQNAASNSNNTSRDVVFSVEMVRPAS